MLVARTVGLTDDQLEERARVLTVRARLLGHTPSRGATPGAKYNVYCGRCYGAWIVGHTLGPCQDIRRKR